MHVILSNHAKERCKQQGIKESWVIKIIKSIPPVDGTVRWLTKNKTMIVVSRQTKNVVTVVTVISKRKLKEYSIKKIRRKKIREDRKKR